jgi:anaerobic magnesium-protoporphyrin IX monomethyl ester cyclase
VKKVLLINERKDFENVSAGWPHLGLVSLGTVLKRQGFEVKVLDMAFVKDKRDARAFVREYAPDIVGLSLYTTTWPKYDALLDAIAGGSAPVIITGGPHASLYYPELLKDPRIDYVVTGEAEEKIVQLCSVARKNPRAEVIHCGYIDVRNVKSLDYSVAYQYERAVEIGIQVERGCPFNCSFCLVKNISSRKVRYRDIDQCIKEVAEATAMMPQLHTIRIIDDCPSFRLDLFKEFMTKFLRSFPHLRINIQHLRADQVDEEMLLLLRKAHVRSLTLGVESANPEVFEFVDKGETLEEIENAALMIKRLGMRVSLAFVLGLPKADYRKEEDSLRFAKRIRPHEIYWNMCYPHKGTQVWDWFSEHGTLHAGRNPSTLIDFNLQFDSPCAETREYPVFDRERAWVRAVIETKSFHFRFSLLPRLFSLAGKYRLWPSVGRLLCDPHNLRYLARDVGLNTLEVFRLTEPIRRLKNRLEGRGR